MTREEAAFELSKLLTFLNGEPRIVAAIEMAIAALRSPGAAEMRVALIEVAARARMNFITTDEAWADRHQPCSMTKAVTPIVDDWLARHALPAREVPDEVRAWVASYDDEATAGAHHLAVDDALREFYRKEYGI